jgi:cytochrome c553
MKKLVLIMVLLAFVGATVAIAADSYTYENKKGTVTFQHKAHQERVAGDCATCHEGTPAKIDVDKTFGHKTCKACHKMMKKGPTKCNDCHKK